MRALLRRALGRNPLDAIGIFVLVLAAGAILVNALYRQPGPHPAPIFSIKPRPVAGEPAGGVVPAMPRARPEVLAAPKPQASSKIEAAAPKAPARPDPIAELIATVAARDRGAARAQRFRLRPGQGDRQLWRRNRRGDPEIRTRPQAAGHRPDLAAPAARACRADRPAAGVGRSLVRHCRSLIPAITPILREQTCPVSGRLRPSSRAMARA